MTERPILFSGPMVRAILEDRKTQTRRVLKPQPRLLEIDDKGPPCQVGVIHVQGRAYNQLTLGNFIPSEPRLHSVGDTLWVREAHSIYRTHGQHRADGQRWGPWSGLPTTVSPDGTQIAYYREGFDRCKFGPWRPSIHMPRWASRISLKVTCVKVERLHDISTADAVAEGCDVAFAKTMQRPDGSYPGNSRVCFRDLWTSINGTDSWEANPWVVAYSFERQADGQ